MNSAAVESMSMLEEHRSVLGRAKGPVVPLLRHGVMEQRTRRIGAYRPQSPPWTAAETARTLVLPPPDRAHWQAPAGCAGPLLYLAWGARQFGVSPIEKGRHDGWTYALVESGTPALVGDGWHDRIAASTLVLIGPDCAYGWHDDPGGISRLLVWLWRQPCHVACRWAPRDALVRISLQPEEQVELRQLHALSRSEIYWDDAPSGVALAGLQALLETRIARIAGRSAGGPRNDILQLALHWIEVHLTTRQPLARLADFLGISPATVQRLFREQLGSTVTRIVAELRLQVAERMLADEGVTIKEVAYSLGYRHPHDFSRAFRRNTGHLPSSSAVGPGGA